jgi:peroxiredoxin
VPITKTRRVLLFIAAVILTVAVAYILGVAAAGIVQKVQAGKLKAERTQQILEQMGSNLGVGVTLPDANLEDLNGNPVQLSQVVESKSLVAIFSPDCSYCGLQIQRIIEAAIDELDQTNFILISDADPMQLTDMRDSLNTHCRIFYDRDGEYKSQLGVTSFPFNFVVDQSLVIEEIIAGTPELDEIREIMTFNRN